MAVTTQRLIFLWGSGAPLTLRSIVNFEVAEQIGEWNFCVRFVVPYDRIADASMYIQFGGSRRSEEDE